MIHRHLTIVVLLCAAAAPAAAQTAVDQPNVKAIDVVTKPLSDLNLRKDEIPPILLQAREEPYTLAGLRTCRAIQNEVGALNAVLGEDIDIGSEKSRGEKRGNAVGNMAKSVINSFIPFNGVIREVSGAAATERQWQVALYAGASRRAFLKGNGQARGCRYPARAATARDVAAIATMRLAADDTPAPVTKKRRKTKR